MSEPVRLKIVEGVAWLTISRPDKLNALDGEMVDAIVPACREIERSAAKVAILTGEGERSFCAGGDIDAWSNASPEAFGRHWVRDGHAAFDALARLAVPLIAVLNGHTLGGRARARRLRRSPDRRGARQDRAAGDGARNNSRLVRNAARGAKVRSAARPAHGALRTCLWR